MQVVNGITFGERFTVGDIVSSGDRGGGHLSGKAPRSKRVTNTINWLCVFYWVGIWGSAGKEKPARWPG